MSFAEISTWDSQPKYRIGFLGGVGEFGRNCTVIEDPSGKLLVIDAGLMFPGPGLPGVDRIIPDFGNFEGREGDVTALVITHGHEDHIGAIGQFLDRVGSCKILASPLASGIFERKLRGARRQSAELVDVAASQEIAIGPFKITFVSANHSIPQTLGALVEVQGDLLYFTGDFRLDDSPLIGLPTDHRQIAELAGGRAIRYMFVDSTNAGQDGQTRRESSVMTSIRPRFRDARGRIYFTTFASHIERQFLAISLAEEFGRKVHVAGFSMRRNVRLAKELGLHNFAADLFVDTAEAKELPPGELMVLASGSQGEPGSFLDRLANGTQESFELRSDDLIVFSSVPIPGNEPRITRNIDKYMRLGAEVLHYRDAHVHVSGHARNDEIGALITVVQPQCVVPVHGDHYNIVRCAELVGRVGPYDSLIAATGDVIEVFPTEHVLRSDVLSARPIYVDDNSDDIPEEVVRDRATLSEQGAIIVHLRHSPSEDVHELIEVRYLGYSGEPIDDLIKQVIEHSNNDDASSNITRLIKNKVYRSIGGPRGRQAKVIILIDNNGASVEA